MKRRWILLPFVFYFLVIGSGILLVGYMWSYRYEKPEQPIKFSHQLHAGKLDLECSLCHTLADKSIRAGVPPVATCMNCHKGVATDRPEVQKVIRHWEERKPIAWVKVHNLPPHVYFSHKRHIRAGVQCSRCHGQVQVMPQIRQVRSLKMGWCVDCHRSRSAATDCWTCHK